MTKFLRVLVTLSVFVIGIILVTGVSIALMPKGFGTIMSMPLGVGVGFGTIVLWGALPRKTRR